MLRDRIAGDVALCSLSSKPLQRKHWHLCKSKHTKQKPTHTAHQRMHRAAFSFSATLLGICSINILRNCCVSVAHIQSGMPLQGRHMAFAGLVHLWGPHELYQAGSVVPRLCWQALARAGQAWLASAWAVAGQAAALALDPGSGEAVRPAEGRHRYWRLEA